MAMYEHEGYCPNSEFTHLVAKAQSDKTISPVWKRTQKLLGDRTGFMVYSPNGYAYKEPSYITDALVRATGTLGIEVATVLKMLIPSCAYSKQGKRIICTDLINPMQIPANISIMQGTAYLDSDDDDIVLLQDERYIVAICLVESVKDPGVPFDPEDNTDVMIFLYKK